MQAMKWLLVLGLISFFNAPPVSPQGRPPDTSDGNLYSAALSASIVEMERSWGHIDDSDGGTRIRTDYRHLVVIQNPEITDHLPPQFGDHHVEYLDHRGQIDRYKKLRKELILEIHPLKNEGAVLNIQVSVAWVEYQRDKILFAVSDWSDVQFRYDCEKQGFVISGVNLGGV